MKYIIGDKFGKTNIVNQGEEQKIFEIIEFYIRQKIDFYVNYVY